MTLTAIALLPGAVVGASRADDVTVETIVAAWQRRHETYRSMRFVMDDRTVFPRYDGSDDLVFDRTHTLHIHGEKFVHECDGKTYDQIKGLVTDQRLVKASTGMERILLFGRKERTDELYPLAFLQPMELTDITHSPAQTFDIWPVFHTFHCGSFLPTTAARWQLRRETGVIDGRRCLLVDWKEYTGIPYRLWIDSQRDFIALRRIIGNAGRSGTQVDVEYSFDEQWGEWIPTAWTAQVFVQSIKGEPLLGNSSKLTVREYELNPEIDASEFDVTFPADTYIIDERDNSRPQFIATGSGRRDVTSDERIRGAQYTDLIKTRSGQALLPPGQQAGFTWVWLALAGALMILVAVWRRR